MAQGIERVIEDVERYRTVAASLIEALHLQIDRDEHVGASLSDASPLAATLALAGSAEKSRLLTQRLEEFETVRREVRLSITTMLLDEGLTTVQIGAAFGVTRQLANRFAREARALDRGIDED